MIFSDFRTLCIGLLCVLLLTMSACNSQKTDSPQKAVAPVAKKAETKKPAPTPNKETALPAVKGKVATAALKGITPEGKMHFSEEDRCPVCAMPITKHQKFASSIELKDGTTYYFCGTGCMIKSWLHPEVYMGQEKSKLKRAIVPEYFNGENVDAATVTFVAGSDVIGPMGPALVPLKNAEDVATFKKRHGGKSTFTMADMNDDLWRKITGKDVVKAQK